MVLIPCWWWRRVYGWLFVFWIGRIDQPAHQLGLVRPATFFTQGVVASVIGRKLAALTAKTVGRFLG
jgi:hypothetical protein